MNKKKKKVRVLHLEPYERQHTIFRRKTVLSIERIGYYVSQLITFCVRNPNITIKLYVYNAQLLPAKYKAKDVMKMFEKCPGNLQVMFR